MPRFLKRLLAVLAVFVLLLMVLAAGLYLFIDPNDYKERITALVHRATGRTLAIEGDMSLSLLPGFALVADRIVLSGPTGQEGPPFARAERLRIDVSLPALLQKRIEVTRLAVSGLDLRLIRFEDGRANWAFSPDAGDPSPSGPKRPGLPALPPGVSLGGLTVQEASVTWEDRTRDSVLRFRGIRLVSEGLTPGRPSRVRLSCVAEILRPSLEVALDLVSRVTFTPDGSRWVLEKTRLKAEAEGNGIPDRHADLDLAAALELDLGDGRMTAKDLSLLVDHTRLEGGIDILDLALPAVSFDLRMTELDLDRYIRAWKDRPKTSESLPSKGTGTAEGLPPVVRAMEVEGRLRAKRVRVSGLDVTDVDLVLNAEKGMLRADPVKARLSGGTLQGRAGLDATGPSPLPSLTLRGEGIQVGPLVRTLTGKEEMTGTARVHMDLQSKGLAPDAWMADMSGPVRFEVTDGTVGFFGAPPDTGKNVYQEVENLEPDRPTPFSMLKGSVNARRGLLSNRDLLFESPVLRATGKGEVDLRNRRVDYELRAILPLLPDMLIHIAGPIEDPDIRLKPLKMLTESVEGLGKQATELPGNVGRGVQDLGESALDLPGSIGDKLKGLFE